MNLLEIIAAWEADNLPQDTETLIAWKNEIDRIEQLTFESWRGTGDAKVATMLFNEILRYADISVAIQDKVMANLFTYPYGIPAVQADPDINFFKLEKSHGRI
ncbi:hypothetical protein [Dyadobacter sp.]|uniref:hypothetical protein n=1 Tax=Dyadobacter sp. TaxID=1914288 RepID=UPI003F716C3A